MNKKDLLFAYILEIPLVLILLFWNFSTGYWVVMITLLVILPLVTLKKPIFQIPDIPNNMPATKIMLFYLCFIIFISLGYSVGHNNYIKIATTDDIKKADEIEALLSAHWYNTIRFVDGTKYTIALHNANKDSYKDAVLSLIYDDVVTEDVAIYLDTKSVAFNKKGYTSKLVKDYKKELPFLINGIVGVYNSTVDVEFSSCFFDMDCGKPYVKANIKIDTDESFDTEEIKELTEKLLLATINGLTKDNIKIEFNIKPCSKQDKCYNHQTTQRLYKKAKYYYSKKDYVKALKYLEQAYNIDPSYTTSFDDVLKVMELDEAIKKAPDDYRLYVQRGDIKNVFEYSMFVGSGESITSDYYGAIDDYTKALELNPKAYEVYEKRGDAWAECGYKRCIGCKRERTHVEDENVIKDYKLAIKYTGGNDNLFEKLGDRYATTAPEKALKYYNMVSNQYPKYENKYIPIPDNAFSTKRAYGYLPLKKAHRYADIEDYDNTFKIFDNILNYEKNETIIQEVNNMKFYYNWKAKHYKQALKNADSCSVWVCKALGLFF